ncbi:hypothetical protein AB0C98_22705 [Streptomyces sp. NPDC048558]|uniref:hypothetical protein n=1 Tax=Streptomyces sp. NPDC048558 TaxID=3155759 RepID=UPI003422A4AD
MPSGKTVDGEETAVLLYLTCSEECVGICSYCDRVVTSFGLEEAEMCDDCVEIRMEKF